MAATGANFSTLTGASAGQDTTFQVYGQTTAANGTLTTSSIQELNGNRAVFTLDAGLPQNSMYLVWPENAAGAGLPFAVNKTVAWWIGSNTAGPGQTVSVYGENLTNGASTPQSWIYVQPAHGQGQWITPTAVNTYKDDFVVPTSLPSGTYQVWVHNGHGGQFGWSSPVTLTVQAPVNYAHLVVKLSDFGGLPNTGTDAIPALRAALQFIGANGPATIQFQAGTYYFGDNGGSTLHIVGGFGLPINLQGAGKGLTFIRPLAGFTADTFLINYNGKCSDMTIDTSGATFTTGGQTAVIGCADLENMAIITRGYQSVGATRLINCDITGMGEYLSLLPTQQVVISGCNFYGTDQTDALIYIWGGNGISITNCTAQHWADAFDPGSSNRAEYGHGRFYVGTGLYYTQQNVYIADNITKNYSQMPGYNDQNTGETVMWEGNEGTQSSMVSSATSSTATLSALGGAYISREAVIVGGKGEGQHRTIVATDFSSGGTTISLDNPWDVIPDGTSRINIVTTVKQVAVYRNTLQGNSNFSPVGPHGEAGSASDGVEIFQGGYDFAVDNNKISNFQYGISSFAYADSSGICALPLFSNIFQNNTITNCTWGIRLMNLNNPYGEAATFIGNIYRNNTLTAIHADDFSLAAGNSTLTEAMDLNVLDHNRASDAPVGIYFLAPTQVGQSTMVVYKNVFNLGTAPLAGSQPIVNQTGFVQILGGNQFLNFLNLQNPTSTTTSLSPAFTWTAIPGATHYYVWISDLSTGQSPVLQNTNVQTNSWTIPTTLTAGHNYMWWLEALDTNGPVTNWSYGQGFSVSWLSTPLLTTPSGSIPVLGNASLTPTFTWSAVTGADTYDLWVNDGTSGQAQMIRQTTANPFFTPAAPLIIGHQYIWWVQAHNSTTNISAWSSGAGFALGLVTPTITGPSGTLNTAYPTFSWNAIATASYYDVWVNDNTTGQSAVLRAPLSGSQLVRGTVWTSPAELNHGHSYTWWVRAMTAAGAASSWSNGASFSVPSLSPPTPVSPSGSATFAGIIFSWNTTHGGDYYYLWVNDVTAGNSQVIGYAHVVGSASGSPWLTPGHTYRWWIQAWCNNGDSSAWSASVDFIAS